MNAYLTVCRGGRGRLTKLPPIISRTKGTRHQDVFERVGEPLNVGGLCHDGMTAALKEHGQKVDEPLKVRRVRFSLEYID